MLNILSVFLSFCYIYGKVVENYSIWEEVEISNYIIKSSEEISETNEYLIKNRNELIENDIAEYITYNYENRSRIALTAILKFYFIVLVSISTLLGFLE